MSVIHWTEITSLHNIRKFTQSHPEILNGNSRVSYKYKVKIHGACCAVQIHQDKIIPQSRTTELTQSQDNYGFARWVFSQKNLWEQIHLDTDEEMVIFGEWAGKGVQQGVAASEISDKFFAVFAARYLDSDNDTLIIDPFVLQDLVKNIPNTYVLPWQGAQIEIDWNASSEELAKQAEEINKIVYQIEKNDPWIENTFGIKGVGEGIVLYPVSQNHLGNKNYSNLCFKAKGDKHKNIKNNAPAQVDASTANSIEQFVDMVLTEARLEQGITTLAGSLSFDMKYISPFLTWISNDVQKETKDELEASNLEWKQVSKSINDKARKWFLSKHQEKA
jgi:hypothetical protein